MKKIIIACLLATSGASAIAEWTRVFDTDLTIFYIDLGTIRKDGRFRKVWEMQDQKIRHENGVLSSRYRIEYDCKEERNRILSFTSYSGSMGSGKDLITGSSTYPWNDIPPKTAFEGNLKIVCAN